MSLASKFPAPDGGINQERGAGTRANNSSILTNPRRSLALFLQFQNVQRSRLHGTLCGQLSGADIDEGEGQGVPALRQVRVPAAQMVHDRHRVHLQSVDEERNQVPGQWSVGVQYGNGVVCVDK